MRDARILPAAALGLLTAAVFLDGGARPAAAFGLQLAVAGLAALAAASPRLRAAPREALALAALWSALALAQLAWATDVDAAADGAAAVLAVTALFLASLCGVGGAARRWLPVGFTALGAAVALVAVAAAEPGARAASPLGNPNHLGGWLLLPAGVAFGGLCLVGEAERRASVAWFGALLLIAAGIAASASRGAGLAAAVAAAALLRLQRWPRRRAAVGVCGGLAAAALALALLPALQPDAVPAQGAGGQRSAGLRWQVWEASARAALEAAPLGEGLGGFAPAFAAQRPGTLAYAPRRAHNEFLDGLVQLGAPFALALALSAWLIVRGIGGAAARAPSVAAAGGAAALLALGVHALIDFAPHLPAVALAAACLGGIAWSAVGTPPARRERAWTRAALAGLSLSLLALSGSGWLALAAERGAERRLASGDFAGAEAVVRRGLRARPLRASLLRHAADAAEHAARLADGGAPALARATALRRAAADASPRRADLRLALAATLYRAGDFAGARAAAARAAALDPAAPGVHLSRARILLGERRPDAAAGALREALARRPLAAHDAVDAWVRATRDPALTRAAVPDLPRAVVGGARALARAGYARDAAREFERALSLSPDDARVATETARSLDAAGEPERAAGVLRETLVRVPGDAGLERELERLDAALAREARRRAAERAT